MRGYWWVPHSDLLTGGSEKKEAANERQRHLGDSPVPLAHRGGNGARLGVLGNLRNRGGVIPCHERTFISGFAPDIRACDKGKFKG